LKKAFASQLKHNPKILYFFLCKHEKWLEYKKKKIWINSQLTWNTMPVNELETRKLQYLGEYNPIMLPLLEEIL